MFHFKNKYLKYKSKYLQLKNQIGGQVPCDRVYRNIWGTCWAVAVQTIITFSDASSDDLYKIMNSIKPEDIDCFIEYRIETISNNPELNNIFPKCLGDIFSPTKKVFLINILKKFIDRYFNKVLNIKLTTKESDEDYDDKKNPLRCEIIIAQNFNNLFKLPFFKLSVEESSKFGGNIIAQYLLINLLSVFFLGYKVSFTNYYDNFNLIQFNPSNDLGILINIREHSCCLYICNGEEKYYNDNDKKVYKSKWIDLLKRAKNLYVESKFPLRLIKSYKLYEKKEDVNNVLFLTVVSKYTEDSLLDLEIKKMLDITEYNNLNLKDKYLLYFLGTIFDAGIDGVAKDEAKAVCMISSAAQQGYPRAQSRLGCMYRDGRGVKQNIKEAIRLLRLAADQGEAIAQYSLGIMIRDGNGILKDDNMAFGLIYYAAKQNLAVAQYTMGLMLENGQGVKKNHKNATLLLSLAMDNGCKEAEVALKRLEKSKPIILKNGGIGDGD
jgi:hypothetical protein